MPYLVLTLLCLAANIAYIQRAAISVPASTIQKQLRIDDPTMGLVLASWYWGYAVLQIPAGLLADRWGSRRTLALGCLLWSLLTGLVGLATDWLGLLVLWTLMGLAQAALVPCAARDLGVWFPDTERAFATGLLGASMVLGTALAPLLTARLLTRCSWEEVFPLYALPGILWVFFYYFLTRETPRLLSVGPGLMAPPARRWRAADWGRLARSVPLWLLSAQQFFRAAAMVFFATWFPRFLSETRGVSQLESGTLTAWICGGAMLGGLAGGTVSDWLLRRTGNRRLSRQGIAVLGMTSCCGLVLASYFVRDNRLATLLMALGAFWASFGGVSGYTVAIELGGTRIATVFSVMNTCGNIGAGLFPLVAGWLLAHYHNWDLILFLFAGLFAVDAVCWALLDPRRPLFEDAN